MSREEASGPGTSERVALVDAHVHLHPRYDEGRFFTAAARNLKAASTALAEPRPLCGVLVLTEIAGVDRFGDLRNRVGTEVAPGAVLEPTDEDLSLRVSWDSGHLPLAVVGGRQIQTREGLEVLAFPLGDGIPDGLPMGNVLDRVADGGAVGMVPWGFGKWWGARGRLVSRLAERAPGSILLADTGHRPSWTPMPKPFVAALKAGGVTVTGSDPLPLPGEESRVGSSCFAIPLSDAERRPACSLVEALSAVSEPPRTWERRPGPLAFAYRQVAMQVRKRFRR